MAKLLFPVLGKFWSDSCPYYKADLKLTLTSGKYDAPWIAKNLLLAV